MVSNVILISFLVALSSLNIAYVIEPYNAYISDTDDFKEQLTDPGVGVDSSESFAIAETDTDGSHLCYGCHKHTGPKDPAKITISEVDLTALRIEYIKQQILKKLRLKEPPKGLMPFTDLPKPIEQGDAILMRERNHAAEDDYFAKTSQAVLFPYDGKSILLNRT